MQEDEIRRLLTDAPEAGCRALFETYWAYAYAVVCRTLRSACGKEEIEECTADVLSDVMLHYDPARSGSLKAYIGTTARRRAIDRGRALSRRSAELSLDSETAPDIPSREDVAAAAEQAELSREVLAAVKALGEPDASIHLSVSAQNLFTITQYKGYDPELETGIDQGAYPKSRTLSVSAEINF